MKKTTKKIIKSLDPEFISEKIVDSVDSFVEKIAKPFDSLE